MAKHQVNSVSTATIVKALEAPDWPSVMLSLVYYQAEELQHTMAPPPRLGFRWKWMNVLMSSGGEKHLAISALAPTITMACSVVLLGEGLANGEHLKAHYRIMILTTSPGEPRLSPSRTSGLQAQVNSRTLHLRGAKC